MFHLLFVFNVGCFALLDLDKTLFVQTTADDFQDIDGSIEIDDEQYTADCDCSEKGLEDIEEVACQPSKIQLVQNTDGEGATFDEVAAELESYDEFAWAKLTDSSFRCLDGRIEDPMLGTPGGDAGEFVLGLLVYQGLVGDYYTQEDVDDILEEYLECMHMAQLYMCTDQAAIDHVEKELVLEDLDIFNPSEDIQAELLETLIKPNNIGDTHLRLMIEYPDLYSINETVVEMFITAYYTILWDDENYLQSSLYLDVLEGSHEETAFLEIRTSKQCSAEQVAPLIQPTTDSFSMLVNHLEATKVRRSQVAHFFATHVADDLQILPTLVERMQHHGLQHLDLTGSYLAKGLPFYTAQFA